MRRMSFKLLIPAGLLTSLLMLNPVAMAVGLGPVEVDTNLNQPLRAEIPLLSIGSLDTDELEVSLASADEFDRVGIDRPAVLTQLSFTVEGGARGPVVRVTSEEPITEPFLSFLVRVSWPQGRLLREYTILLDPPVTAPAAAPQPEQAPAQAVRRGEEAGAETPAAGRSPGAGEPSRAGADRAAEAGGGRYGPVSAGETLWRIAERTRPDDSVSVNQMMLALLRTNPDAFFRDNINALRRGAVLRVPDREEIRRLGVSEALAAVRRQNDLWQDYRRNLAQEAPTVVAGGESQDRAPVQEPAEDEGSRLELVPPREGEAEAGAATAGAGQQGAEADRNELREELARTREELLARREENDQLDGRVGELEAQVDRLQRLLELKNEELATIQSQTADDGREQAAAQEPDSIFPEAGEETASGADQDGAEGAGTQAAAGTDERPADQAPGAAPADEPDTAAREPEAAADEGAGEPAEEPEAEETQAAPPPAPPRGGGWMDFLLSPVVLGIAGLLLIGIGVAVFLHRRGGREAASTVQRESLGARMARRSEAEETRESPASQAEESAGGESEEDFGPPEAGPADYDEAALRSALEDNPEDTETRLKLIRHYAAVGNREAFIAQAETLYAELADPASPAWLETRELGEEVAPEHALFGGSSEDVRSSGGDTGETLSVPETESDEWAPAEPETPEGPAPSRETGAGEPEAELPDLEFESPADEEPATDETKPQETGDETRPEETAGEDAFDLSGFDTGEPEEAAGRESGPEQAEESRTGEAPGDESFDFGETAESRDTDEQEPLEFDLSDFESESSEDETPEDRESPAGEADIEDWMTDTAGESAPESGGDETVVGLGDEGEGDEVGPDDGGETEGTGGDAVDTKLELAEAYLDMSDEEGAREMLEEVLSEGDEGQKKRAREMLDKLS